MYTIIRRGEHKWLGIYPIQDGTQRFEESTREKAIRRLIDCARIMNGVHITENDIEFKWDSKEEKVEGISVTREEARMQTIDVLINAMDDLHLANLKLRVSLDAIEHSLSISDCTRIAREALR